MCKVSVVVPTYNRCYLLERAIRSVLSQTYRKFEIIVIDDASDDSTETMVREKFCEEIEKGILGYLKNETKKERSYSRNKGMEVANGEYIALLDDDDFWLPNHLEVLIEYMSKRPEVKCAFSNAFILYDDNKTEAHFRNLRTGDGNFYRDLCVMGKMDLPTTSMFSKEVYKKIGGFREDLVHGENWEFLSRIAMNFNVGYVQDITCCFYSHRGSYSRGQDRVFHLEKLCGIIKENSIKYQYFLGNKKLANLYLVFSRKFIPDMQKARKYLWKAIKSDWHVFFKISLWRIMVRVILGRCLYLKVKNLRTHS